MYCEWEINPCKHLRLRGCFCMYPCLVAQLGLLETLWTVAHQAPLSLWLSRQEYWSGLPFPPPGDLPNPGIKPVSPVSPALQAVSLLTRNKNSRTSLAVQWLWPWASIAVAWIGSLVGELRSDMLHRVARKDKKKKQKNNSLVAQDIQHQVDEGLPAESWFSS